MPVVSLRLGERDLRQLQKLAKQEDKDRSAMARDLLNQGYKFKLLLRYKDGKYSLGRLSEAMGLTVSETLDFLGDLGLPAPLAFDDYLQGFSSLERLRRGKR